MRSVGPEFEVALPSMALVVMGFGLLACGSATSPQETRAVAGSREPSSPQAGALSERTRKRTLELGGERRFSYRVDCRRDQDCAIASVLVDCCGSYRALGVRAGERRDLERQVEASTTFRASCECLASPTYLDDGSEAEVGASVGVRCEQSQCMSYSPSPRSPAK
jgi:hypothetical protein